MHQHNLLAVLRAFARVIQTTFLLAVKGYNSRNASEVLALSGASQN
jgi:hypothetical protein